MTPKKMMIKKQVVMDRKWYGIISGCLPPVAMANLSVFASLDDGPDYSTISLLIDDSLPVVVRTIYTPVGSWAGRGSLTALVPSVMAVEKE